MKKIVTILAVMMSSMISAQNTPSVSVVGKGAVYATPDVVNISLSIENQGVSVKELKQLNGEAVAKVIQFLMKELPSEDFQTDFVSLNKHYDYDLKKQNYHISQGIKIRLSDLSKYEMLMENLFELGVNQINSVSFDVKNREALLKEARLAAIQDAQQKALFYAVNLGQNVGKALSITENNDRNHFYDNEPLAEARMMSSAPKQTLAVGTISVFATINVVFELLKN